MARTPDVLEVRNFAQIRRARIELGDVTVLVGPQATGKSLVLQLLKWSIDSQDILWRLARYGLHLQTQERFYELYLGEGMGQSWRRTSSVQWRGSPSGVRYRGRIDRPSDKVFYVPAQRALVLAEGWPRPFDLMDERTPVVARLFSDSLFRLLFGTRVGRDLFPVDRFLNPTLVELIADAIFHGGRIALRKRGDATKLELELGRSASGIQFPAWSTGQREFTPLLLALHSVLADKDSSVEWVVLEEPEMGLHPRGIEVAMLLALELVRRGAKLVLSTHSPIVLETIWAIQRLAENKAAPRHVLEVFGVEGRRDLLPLARRALAARFRVFALDYRRGAVESQDISDLDPASPKHAEAFWGGLTELSSRVSDIVTRLSR